MKNVARPMRQMGDEEGKVNSIRQYNTTQSKDRYLNHNPDPHQPRRQAQQPRRQERQTDERRKTQPRHRLTRYETHKRLVHLISLPSTLIRIRDDPVRQLVLVGERLLFGRGVCTARGIKFRN
jgi:hypothetical protein